VPVACRALLAVVFLAAAVGKITDLERWEDQILLHSDLPALLGQAVVAVLPWLELTCGLCLALGYAVREAAVCVAVMLLAFAGYTLLVPAEHDCGCLIFTGPSPIGRWWHMAGDLALLAACIPVVRACGSPREKDHDALKRGNADRPG
jgi:uncharacterized membrane protein YphA (DoxX/SURF4 family)